MRPQPPAMAPLSLLPSPLVCSGLGVFLSLTPSVSFSLPPPSGFPFPHSLTMSWFIDWPLSAGSPVFSVLVSVFLCLCWSQSPAPSPQCPWSPLSPALYLFRLSVSLRISLSPSCSHSNFSSLGLSPSDRLLSFVSFLGCLLFTHSQTLPHPAPPIPPPSLPLTWVFLPLLPPVLRATQRLCTPGPATVSGWGLPPL